MKKFVLLLFCMSIFTALLFSQNPTWNYDKVFKSGATGINAVVMDKKGNIWYASKSAEIGLNVVKKDGTPLSFSPINSVTIGGSTINTKTGCNGLQIDSAGNIIAIFNGNDLIRINSNDGTGMTYKQIPAIGTNKEVSDFGIDTLGNIYLTHIQQPAPIDMYDKNFNFKKKIANVATDAPNCKAITVNDFSNWPDAVSGNGIQVYSGLSDGGSGIFHFRAAKIDSNFVLIDTIFKTLRNVVSFNWEKTTAGVNKSRCWVGLSRGVELKVDLGSDQKNKGILDSIKTATLTNPRGVCFSSYTLKTDTAWAIDNSGNSILQFKLVPFQAFNNWSFVKVFDVAVVGGRQPHGVIVDRDGNIWIASYGGWDTKHATGKTLKSIMVIKPDGSVVDTIWRVTAGGVTDTLLNSCRGFSMDPDGNILFSHFNVIYRINYKTRLGMSRVAVAPNSGTTKTACDAAGNWIVSFTLPNDATSDGVKVYDKDFNLLGYVAERGNVINGITRTLEMTPDGKDVYVGSTAANGLARYHSDNGAYGPYSFVDYVGGPFGYVDAEALGWDPKGRLWVGSHSRSIARYDAWDLKQMKIVDNINPAPGAPATSAGAKTGFPFTPRGISFSADGKTCYTADFDGGVIQVWTNTPTSVNNNSIPEKYSLSQNYPNPFNPTTNIRFTIPNTENVNITIYDVFGREVFKLLDNVKYQAGNYEVTWTGRNTHGLKVASGTYFYQLKAGKYEKFMKMMLIK